MNNEFCPRDCEYLSITEAEQNKCNTHWPHICNKYDVKLFHLLAHSDLWKCEQCYKENTE